MTKRITVSRPQVAAAKLKIQLLMAAGQGVDPATKAIARARKAGTSPRTRANPSI